MLRMCVAALALAAQAGLIAAEAAGEAKARVTFATGPWRGEAYFDGESFTHCRVQLRYADGGQLDLDMRPGGPMLVGLGKSGWALDPAANLGGVRLEVDPGFTKDYPAKVDPARRGEIWFTVGNDPELRRALAQGRALVFVDVAGKRWPFPLQNGAAAVRKLTACVLLFSPP
jgi:hypothetical protein